MREEQRSRRVSGPWRLAVCAAAACVPLLARGALAGSARVSCLSSDATVLVSGALGWAVGRLLLWPVRFTSDGFVVAGASAGALAGAFVGCAWTVWKAPDVVERVGERMARVYSFDNVAAPAAMLALVGAVTGAGVFECQAALKARRKTGKAAEPDPRD